MSAWRLYARSPAAVLGALLVLAVVAMGLLAPFLYPDDPFGLAGWPLQWPGDNPRFPLGTDPSGRDIAAQVFHGARVSLLIGFAATLIAVAIGIAVGPLAGYYGGAAGTALMRVTEAFQTLPNFLLLLLLVAVFGSDLRTITVGIGAVSWPPVARLTRAEFLTLRTREFVRAARLKAWATRTSSCAKSCPTRCRRCSSTPAWRWLCPSCWKARCPSSSSRTPTCPPGAT